MSSQPTPVYTLISATPSPYARKIRIALQEKNLPFTLQTEVPWDSTTQTPLHNPLEKLPVLILDDEKKTALYESHYILDWLETNYPEPALLPKDVDERLEAKKVEVVADGVCDALVLALFESKREPEKQSKPCLLYNNSVCVCQETGNSLPQHSRETGQIIVDQENKTGRRRIGGNCSLSCREHAFGSGWTANATVNMNGVGRRVLVKARVRSSWKT